MKGQHLSLMIALLFPLLSCKKDEPIQPPASSVQLSVRGASCTEAWLKVALTDNAQPRTVALQRDGQSVLTVQLTGADSILMDEGLLPRHSYSYRAVRMRDTVATDVSGPVQVMTMDTTSHEFFWTADTLGEGFSNMLNDVAVISDTLAYGVGELYLRDSTGHLDPHAYNVTRWNGQAWQSGRIPFIGPCSAVDYPPIMAIWPLSMTDIVVTNGGSMVTFDGVSATMDCRMNPLLAGGLSRIWAASSQDMYGVGDVGTIVHLIGDGWQRVESGTTETINDVWGGSNPILGENVVVMAVGWRTAPGESKLLIIHGASTQVDTLSWPYRLAPRRSVWFDRNSRIYTCGAGFYVSARNGWQYVPEFQGVGTEMVRGNGANDIMVVGDYGLVAHYNGSTWRVYPNAGADRYEAVAIRGNVVAAVGWIGTRAITLVGRR